MFGHSERNTSPGLSGLYAGKVEEQRERGQLVVSIPSVFQKSDPEYHALARPCMPYGHFYVPEVGDQVWLAFENGDPAAPVWLGVFYPTEKMPSEAGSDSDPPTKRVIQTKAGHFLKLDDSDGNEEIVLKDKNENSVALRKDEVRIEDPNGNSVALLKDKVVIQDANGNSLELGASKVLLTCTQDLTIDASGKNVEIKASLVNVNKG